MAKLIGHITYPAEAHFSVEYAKLYRENDAALLEFRLINRGKKTVNAYRVDISYTINGKEKTESVQDRNLELTPNSTTDLITLTLPCSAEEGTIALSAVIYEDLSHNEAVLSFPFATFDIISRTAETVLSGATPIAAPTAPVKTETAKKSAPTVTAPQTSAAQPNDKKSPLPLILALSSLGGFVLTFILRLVVFGYVADRIKISATFLLISLISMVLYTGCAALALTAILLGKNNPRHRAGVLCAGIGTLLLYLYFQASALGIFFLVPLVLAIVFFILSLVKKNMPLLIVTASMILLLFTIIGMASGCLRCASAKEEPPTPNDTTLAQAAEQTNPSPNDTSYGKYMVLQYVCCDPGSITVSGYSYAWPAQNTQIPIEYIPIINGKVDLVIPEYTADGDLVTAIGQNAFQNSEEIVSLTLPSGVTEIHESAFENCINLKTANLGSVHSIGMDAFRDCSNLESVTGLDSLSDLQPRAFYSCSALQSIPLSSSLSSVGEYALAGTALTSATIPYNVISLGEGIFENCDSLVSASISCSIYYLPDNTFRYCSSLETVSLPYDMREIGNSAFEQSSLVHITLPETIETINTAAFFQCDKLERIFIPYSIASISNNAFYECSSLHTVYWGRIESELGYISFGNGNENLFEASTQYFGFYNVYFSENDDGTYTLNAAYPDNRTEFVIPDVSPNGKKISVISNSCFKGNQRLQTITIPLSVTSIEYEAFHDCIALEKVIFEGTEIDWNRINISYGNEALKNAEIEFLNRTYAQ